MRRKEREVTDYGRMLEIVEACDCCRIGLTDERGAYIVPLNFGWENRDGELILYFHGANEGKKIDLIRSQPEISFEMDTRHELTAGKTACSYSYLYQSVMGRGRIEILQELSEKAHGLDLVMEHYTAKKEWKYPEPMLRQMAVLKLTVTEWSGKEH